MATNEKMQNAETLLRTKKGWKKKKTKTIGNTIGGWISTN